MDPCRDIRHGTLFCGFCLEMDQQMRFVEFQVISCFGGIGRLSSEQYSLQPVGRATMLVSSMCSSIRADKAAEAGRVG